MSDFKPLFVLSGLRHERVMFGIDSLFHHLMVKIHKVIACDVDEEGLENIFYNNASKFMGLWTICKNIEQFEEQLQKDLH